MSVSDLIKELKELEEKSGEPFIKPRLWLKRKEIVAASEVEKMGIVVVDNWVLTWHPKIRTKKWPTGCMMIYTRDSYAKAQNAIETYKQKNWK